MHRFVPGCQNLHSGMHTSCGVNDRDVSHISGVIYNKHVFLQASSRSVSEYIRYESM